MNESEFNALRELSWRRPLLPAEEARLQQYLAVHPEAQAQWESDLALNQLLAELPTAPVSSNFTALVLQTVDRELFQPERRSTPLWTRWWPRLAWSLCVPLVAGLGLVQYQKQAVKKLDSDVALMVTAMPSEPRVLEDFDAIQRLGQGPVVVDEELWVALAQNTP